LAAIIASVIHAPETHIVKVIRALYYAVKIWSYGSWRCSWCSKGDQGNTQGIAMVDGTVFVRAAGVAMDTLGWVTFGQKEGELGSQCAWVG